MSAFPEAEEIGREEWDTLSYVSARTGRQERRGRNLSLETDHFVISQIVKKGAYETPLQNLCCYSLDGVVVVTTAEISNSTQLDEHFRFCVVPSEVLQRGVDRYKEIEAGLVSALDGEDRLMALAEVLEKGRAFYGLDLGWLPTDLPLLHFCAKHGYSECVEALLRIEGFTQSLGHRCKHRYTVLHLVAWSGHRQVLDALGAENVQKLCDVSNEYGELPETAAIIRSVDLRQTNSEAAGDCEAVAIQLRRSRLSLSAGTGTGYDSQAVTLADFVREANSSLAYAVRVDKVLLPYCVAPEAVVQQFEHCSLRCTELVARQVELAGPLPVVLQSLQENCNLERLVLNSCSLTHSHAELMALFLQGFPFTLQSLELAGNHLGDDGVEKLCQGGGLQRVQSLSLGSTGMTLRGLGALAPTLTQGALERLLVGDNDFEATDSVALEQFQSFLSAVVSSRKLQELDMGKTRLQTQHLDGLARMIENVPCLQRLKLNQIVLKDEYASLDLQQNPFLHALSRPSCQVTRLEVMLQDYPDLFRAFVRTVKTRNNVAGKGKGKGKGNGEGKESSKGKGKGKGKLKDMSRSSAGHPDTTPGVEGEILEVPTTLQGRLRLRPAPHPDFHPSAELCCESFSVDVDVNPDTLPDHADGNCFEVDVTLRWDTGSSHYTLGSAPARQCARLFWWSCRPGPNNFAGLSAVQLVFHSAGRVLFVPRHSPGASLLMRRLKDFALSGDYVLQERFGQTGRRTLRQLNLTEVLADIKLSDFSDEEVQLIANADDFDCYLAWIDAPTATPRHRADHARYLQTQLFKDLLVVFDRELRGRLDKARTGAGSSASGAWASAKPRPALALPSVQLQASRVSGHDNQRRISLALALEECLLMHFAGCVGLQHLPNVRQHHATELVEEGGRWKKLLFHVEVPESMEEGQGQARVQGQGQRQVKGAKLRGLRPCAHPPQWLHMDEVEAYTGEPQLADALRRTVAKAPALKLAWCRGGDATALKVRNRLSMNR